MEWPEPVERKGVPKETQRQFRMKVPLEIFLAMTLPFANQLVMKRWGMRRAIAFPPALGKRIAWNCIRGGFPLKKLL